MIDSKKIIQVYHVLQVAVAMCFIGHGIFGFITKEIWCNYFGVFGIGWALSYQLMPVVGTMDIFMGLLMLVYPVRAIPVWLVIWGTVTALCRPLSGEPFAEFIERAGNFGAPMALLILCGFPGSFRELFTRIRPSAIRVNQEVMDKLNSCLKVVVFLLLAGHGWLNLIEKKALLSQYASVGFSNPAQVAQMTGIAEIIAAFLVLIKPLRPFLLAFFIWKMFSELFYPHYELFEWIERGGSYGSILALWLITENKALLKWPFENIKMQAQQLISNTNRLEICIKNEFKNNISISKKRR